MRYDRAGREASEEFRAVSESTKRNRRSALKDMGISAIAKMPSKLLAAKGAPRTIKAWRAQEAAKRGPRAADFRVQILSRALNWAIGEGLASANPAAKMKPASCARPVLALRGRCRVATRRILAGAFL